MRVCVRIEAVIYVVRTGAKYGVCFGFVVCEFSGVLRLCVCFWVCLFTVCVCMFELVYCTWFRTAVVLLLFCVCIQCVYLCYSMCVYLRYFMPSNVYVPFRTYRCYFDSM